MSGKFSCNNGSGFHLELPNGVSVSTQFGPGNYGDNYNDDFREKQTKSWSSYEVESAAYIHAPGIEEAWWITEEYVDLKGKKAGDMVIGYRSMDEWLHFLDWCRNFKADKETIRQKCQERQKKKDEWRIESRKRYPEFYKGEPSNETKSS